MHSGGETRPWKTRAELVQGVEGRKPTLDFYLGGQRTLSPSINKGVADLGRDPSCVAHSLSHQHPEVNYLPRFGLQLISLEE